MAAHKLTGLRQVIEDFEAGRTEYLAKTLPGAINLDCWTSDDLIQPDETNVWHILVRYDAGNATAEETLEKLKAQLPRIEREWRKLGEPSTREEWYKAKYEGFSPSRDNFTAP